MQTVADKEKLQPASPAVWRWVVGSEDFVVVQFVSNILSAYWDWTRIYSREEKT